MIDEMLELRKKIGVSCKGTSLQAKVKIIINTKKIKSRNTYLNLVRLVNIKLKYHCTSVNLNYFMVYL